MTGEEIYQKLTGESAGGAPAAALSGEDIYKQLIARGTPTAAPDTQFPPETAETRRIGDLMTPGPPTAQVTGPQPGVNIPGVSGPPPGLNLGEVGRAAKEGYDSGAIFTPLAIQSFDHAHLGLIPRGINLLAGATGGLYGGVRDVVGQAADSVLPGAGRDATQAMDLAAPFVGQRAPEGVAPWLQTNRLAARAAGADNAAAPLPQAFRDNPIAPGAENRLAAAATTPPTPNIPTMTVRPGAVGADITQAPIPPKTPAERIADLEKSVKQTAEDRAGPQLRDDTAYVPGIPDRLLASRDFSDPKHALDEKVAIAQDPEFRKAQEANKRERNAGMVDHLANDAMDQNALERAHEARSEVSPAALGVFDGEKPVDASGLVKTIQGLLDGPDGKQAAVKSTLNNVLQSLHDGDGNIETAPSMIYGARKNLTDLLKKGVKGTGDMADDVRASKHILTSLLPDFDQTITEGAPKFSTQYLPQFHELSKPIDQMEFLQKYQTGAKKITDGDGYLQPNKVQKMLDDVLQGLKAPGVNAAKSLTEDQIQHIIAVRNELAAGKLQDRLGSVKGSDSFQQMNRAGVMGGGPLGAALRGGAEMAGHYGVHALDPTGVSNMALLTGRMVVAPAIKAAREQKIARQVAQRKNELLAPPDRNRLVD